MALPIESFESFSEGFTLGEALKRLKIVADTFESHTYKTPTPMGLYYDALSPEIANVKKAFYQLSPHQQDDLSPMLKPLIRKWESLCQFMIQQGLDKTIDSENHHKQLWEEIDARLDELMYDVDVLFEQCE